MNSEAITIRGLEKAFPNFKLGPLDLSVPKGVVYGLIGPNGAGKTTTIDLIMGMGHKDAGSIRVFGLDHVQDEVVVKRQVGYVSPEMDFSPWTKVGRALNFMRSFYADWDDDYCMRLLERFKIGWNEDVAALSHGAKTKLNLVVALSHRPALLLMDEPQAGLDAIAKKELFTELLEAVQDENHTVLISSHNLADLERFTDHIGILHNGKLLVSGATSDLLERFRMVDCILDAGARPSLIPGVYVQEHRDSRWHLLVDTAAGAMDRLKEMGPESLAVGPVTLEELLVGMVK